MLHQNEFEKDAAKQNDALSASPLPSVAVIGLGYIGLPSAAVIAQAGCKVTGVDTLDHVVETINRGEIHIEETDLDQLVRDMVTTGRLSATTTMPQSDVFVIAVPTPIVNGREPDISYVVSAAEQVAPALKAGDLVILESTSPVGTTREMAKTIAAARPDLKISGATDSDDVDVHLAYCPERVLPGKIIAELVSNDRSIGGLSPACATKAKAFYEIFVQGECSETQAEVAEMVKLVENASRDVAIAFANELSLVADRLGLDVWEVISLANRHPRVNIMNPGPGVGGHCIAVDPWFLVSCAPDVTPLMRTAREVNDGKCVYVQGRADAMAQANPDAKIACLGLSFKPNIDDLRESPALDIALALAKKHGPRVMAVEPHIDTLPDSFADTGAQLVSLEAALAECDIVLLLVDHAQFLDVSKDALADKQVYDTRGSWGLGSN